VVASTVGLYGGWHALLTAWRETGVPEGWRAEIVGEAITVMPPPDHARTRIVSTVDRALAAVVPSGWVIRRALGVVIASQVNLFVPDLVVVPETAVDGPADFEPVPADRALLVVQIPSEGATDDDRRTRRRGYACAGVPLYLLVDRFGEGGRSVTLFADPVAGHYQHHVRIPFGEQIAIPEPFAFQLDTSGF
jgi:Uma2 family endonuclease